ncbi:hypothetical protein J2X81_003213 [Sinomonas atrocyanea]|nr:hypothetical protein [Sinomonas atrocyanea]
MLSPGLAAERHLLPRFAPWAHAMPLSKGLPGPGPLTLDAALVGPVPAEDALEGQGARGAEPPAPVRCPLPGQPRA